MNDNHPLDRPVWHALRTRQRPLAIGDGNDKGGALRMQPDHGHFAAAADQSAASQAALGALVPTGDLTWIVETEDAPAPPGTIVLECGPAVQMVATRPIMADPAFAFVDLTEADAVEMRALAHLTKSGPFLSATHRLGDFVGVKQHGKLIAMTGERIKLDGFTEVSGVATHPDHRGRGLAGHLVRVVAERIVARGETPFLHAYAGNTNAIALYEMLGFTLRRTMRLTVLGRA